MNRFERLHKMDMEGFSEAVVAVISEMPYCYNKYCPFLSADGFVCRSHNSKEHCKRAIISYLSEELNNMFVTDKTGSVIFTIVILIMGVAFTAFTLLTK